MATAARIDVSKAGMHRLDEAILCIARSNIKPALRQELKNLGISNIYNADNQDACIEELRRHPRALFIIDWEHGAKDASVLLHAAQSEHKVDTRPIFMIASSVSLEVVAASTEYNVSRMHTGEISRGVIQGHLEALITEENETLGTRDVMMQAVSARARGELKAASAMLETLCSQFPSDKRIACELADVLIEDDQWEAAQKVLDQITAQDKINLRAMHLKARCFMKLGSYEAAAAILHEAKLINPHHVERLVDLGKCLMNCNRVREAIKSFEQALELEPSNVEAQRGRAQCKLMTGDVNDALSLLRDTSGPRELASIFNIAAILSIRGGRFDAGTSLYKTAIGTIGTEGRVMARLVFNLGVAFHKQKRLDEALECFERAYALDRHFEKSKHNATVVAAKLGRKSKLGAPPAGAQMVEEFSEVDDEKPTKL